MKPIRAFKPLHWGDRQGAAEGFKYLLIYSNASGNGQEKKVTKQKQKLDNDKEFVITGISRAEVREICGNAVADRLSDEDMERLAAEMAEVYVSGFYVDDLREIIEQKFDDDSAEE